MYLHTAPLNPHYERVPAHPCACIVSQGMKHGDVDKGLKEKRSTSVMSKRISHLLRDIIVPMGINIDKLPAKTSFTISECDILHGLFADMLRECPTLARDPTLFCTELFTLCERHFGCIPAPHFVRDTHPNPRPSLCPQQTS